MDRADTSLCRVIQSRFIEWTNLVIKGFLIIKITNDFFLLIYLYFREVIPNGGQTGSNDWIK